MSVRVLTLVPSASGTEEPRILDHRLSKGFGCYVWIKTQEPHRTKLKIFIHRLCVGVEQS